MSFTDVDSNHAATTLKLSGSDSCVVLDHAHSNCFLNKKLNDCSFQVVTRCGVQTKFTYRKVFIPVSSFNISPTAYPNDLPEPSSFLDQMWEKLEILHIEIVSFELPTIVKNYMP